MSDFLGNYGFFILIALLMVVCHLGHGRQDDERGKGGPGSGGGHQH